MLPLLLAGTALLGACSVSTEGGALWPAQTLAGEPVPQVCLSVVTAGISGRRPWLEQEARSVLLEGLAPLRENCRGRADAIRLDIREIRTPGRVDAWGRPDPVDADVSPAPARWRIELAASFEQTRCPDGALRRLELQRGTWIAWETDPFLREEREAAVVRELARRLLLLAASRSEAFACDADDLVPTAADGPPGAARADSEPLPGDREHD